MNTQFSTVCQQHALMLCRLGVSSKVEGLFRDLLGFELSHSYEVSRECTVQAIGVARGDLCVFSSFPTNCLAYLELKNYYQFDLNDIKGFHQTHPIKTSIASDLIKLGRSSAHEKYFIVLWTAIRSRSAAAAFCKYTDKCAKSTQWVSGLSGPGASFGWLQQTVAVESDNAVGLQNLAHTRISDPGIPDIYIDALLYKT